MRIVCEEKETSDAKPDAAPQSLPSTPLPAAPTRYVAQVLYAPLRTAELLLGVRPEDVRLAKTIITLLPALLISAMPVDGWKLNPYHLMAIQLRSKGTIRLEPDPHQFRGRFYAASFQHCWLGPADSAGDTTMPYLITHHQRSKQAILPKLESEKDE